MRSNSIITNLKIFSLQVQPIAPPSNPSQMATLEATARVLSGEVARLTTSAASIGSRLTAAIHAADCARAEADLAASTDVEQFGDYDDAAAKPLPVLTGEHKKEYLVALENFLGLNAGTGNFNQGQSEALEASRTKKKMLVSMATVRVFL
jgi:hypothetical protein